MKSFRVGWLSSAFGVKAMIIFSIPFILILAFLGYHRWQDSSAGCISCHANKEQMKRLGYPQFYVTREMVEKQSRHSDIQCRDCHLGNGRAKDADSAHKGMLKVLLVSEEGTILDRKKVYPEALLPTGNDKIMELLPKVEKNGRFYLLSDVRNVLWHDRDPGTLNFDPKIAEKTCGKSGCHSDQLKQFRTSIMARNYRQRTMRTWLEPYGPHNCGPSFADLLPPEVLNSAGFSFKNTGAIAEELDVPFTKKQAIAKQRFCNVCHAGCLDCHYTPSNKDGVHSFTRKPPAESCDGYGRGTSICHPGAMQSRRGETYIGGDYSIPTGEEPDVHYKKNIQCVDCHPTGDGGMGHIQRKAICQDCHVGIEDTHAKGIHKNLDCSTCHVNELRGYQITIWGPGIVAGRPNPFNKFSLYYGIQKPPILMKDQKGIWMPVKVWPHSVGNIKEDVKPSPRIMFRWPNGETRDAYYIIGTVDGLPADNRQLLWLEIEQAAHPFGKARSCESCHESGTQVSVSTWRFEDDQGAEPFSGTYRIVADKDALRIVGMRNTTPIKLIGGAKLADFASWIYLKDRWKAPGDFSIMADREKYKRFLSLSREVEKQLARLDALSKGFDKKTMRRYKEMKGAVLHDEEGALKMIDEFKSRHRL